MMYDLDAGMVLGFEELAECGLICDFKCLSKGDIREPKFSISIS